MHRENVYGIPVTDNKCGPLLRSVCHDPARSIAHMTLNPKALEKRHFHESSDELYFVTQGMGYLHRGNALFNARPGDVLFVPRGISHCIGNTGITSMECLVVALPPLGRHDVHLEKDEYRQEHHARPIPPAIMKEAPDGWETMHYSFKAATSIAFSWVTDKKTDRKPPHHHKHTKEMLYVVEGNGTISINSHRTPLAPGDCIEIKPFTPHALRTDSPQYMVVASIYTPGYSEKDIHFK